MANTPKEKKHQRTNKMVLHVSDHDLETVGGRSEMNKLLRETRDNTVKELCGCEVCQSGNKC